MFNPRQYHATLHAADWLDFVKKMQCSYISDHVDLTAKTAAIHCVFLQNTGETN